MHVGRHLDVREGADPDARLLADLGAFLCRRLASPSPRMDPGAAGEGCASLVCHLPLLPRCAGARQPRDEERHGKPRRGAERRCSRLINSRRTRSPRRSPTRCRRRHGRARGGCPRRQA